MGGLTESSHIKATRATWSDSRGSTDDFPEVESEATFHIWHLHDCSHSPVEMPLFYARLAFVALNMLHTSIGAEIWSHCGPLFVSGLATDIWTPLLLPNFNPIQGGQKGAGVSPIQKSLSIMLLSHRLTRRQCVGVRENQRHQGTGLLRVGGGEPENRVCTPQGNCASPQLPSQRLQRGQSVQEWELKQQLLRKSEAGCGGAASSQGGGCLNTQAWKWTASAPASSFHSGVWFWDV